MNSISIAVASGDLAVARRMVCAWAFAVFTRVKTMTESAEKFPQANIIDQVLIGLSISAYMFALVLPVMLNGSSNPLLLGIHTLAYVHFPPWYANPLSLISLVLYFSSHHRYAWMFSLVAIVLSLFPLGFLSSGETLGLGYYLWVASVSLLGGANVHQRITRPINGCSDVDRVCSP